LFVDVELANAHMQEIKDALAEVAHLDGGVSLHIVVKAVRTESGWTEPVYSTTHVCGAYDDGPAASKLPALGLFDKRKFGIDHDVALFVEEMELRGWGGQ
jgi:hypothetical protein